MAWSAVTMAMMFVRFSFVGPTAQKPRSATTTIRALLRLVHLPFHPRLHRSELVGRTGHGDEVLHSVWVAAQIVELVGVWHVGVVDVLPSVGTQRLPGRDSGEPVFHEVFEQCAATPLA